MVSVLFVIAFSVLLVNGDGDCTDAAHQVSATACTTDCTWTALTPSCTAPTSAACTAALGTCTTTVGCVYSGAVGVCNSANDVTCAAIESDGPCIGNGACSWKDAGETATCLVASCTDDVDEGCIDQTGSNWGCRSVFPRTCVNVVKDLLFGEAKTNAWCSANTEDYDFSNYCESAAAAKSQTQLYEEGCEGTVELFANTYQESECDFLSVGECLIEDSICKSNGGSLSDAECASKYSTDPVTCLSASFGVCKEDDDGSCIYDDTFSLFTCAAEGGVCNAASNNSGQCVFYMDINAPYTCEPEEPSAAVCAANLNSGNCGGDMCVWVPDPAHCEAASSSCTNPAPGVTTCAGSGCTYSETTAATCTPNPNTNSCGSAGPTCTSAELTKGCKQAPAGTCTAKSPTGSAMVNVPFGGAVLLVFLLFSLIQ